VSASAAWRKEARLGSNMLCHNNLLHILRFVAQPAVSWYSWPLLHGCFIAHGCKSSNTCTPTWSRVMVGT
jgi:hypothetical protein